MTNKPTAMECCQQVILELTERYEEMFFHFSAMRSVLASSNNFALLTEYGNLAADPMGRANVHAAFGEFLAEAAKIGDETKASDLISLIPRASRLG